MDSDPEKSLTTSLLIADMRRRISEGGQLQLEFESILGQLAEIRLHKVKQYGTARYEEPDADVNLWMCYSDIFRKTIRLKQLTRDAVRQFGQDPAKVNLDALADLFTDLANYSVMGVQIMQQLKIQNQPATPNQQQQTDED